VNPINFLIEENYAKSPEAAHKILEAASEDFHDYILQESSKKQKLKQLATKLAKSATKQVLKSKPAKSVKRFLKYTTLGLLPLP
jgi:hypothetical protein